LFARVINKKRKFFVSKIRFIFFWLQGSNYAILSRMKPRTAEPHFHFLTPDVIIRLVEEATGWRLTSLCRPYKSYINRVYELAREDGAGIVAKFYRPGRWSRAALLDEHTFLRELAEAEIPVIAPYLLTSGTTLGECTGTSFALFPKKGGRNCDEFSPDQWLELGRLMGRVHAVGARRMPQDRITLTPGCATRAYIDFIVRGGFIPADFAKEYTDTAAALITLIEPLFAAQPLIRIHGDCYFANIIYRPGESFYLIDFDDMAIGPAVHDVWMLLPGYVRNSRYELSLFSEGYETFMPFERRSLHLVEPLRAMRYIHFTAWCAHQVADGGFSVLVPGWGTRAYWRKEIDDLREQIALIKAELGGEE